MEIANSVIDIVKNVGPIIWRYMKYQLNPNFYVGECGEKQRSLQCRHDDIERDLESQLMGLGKIPKKEVEDWLEKVKKATKTNEDQFNKGGCFCNICRAKHFDERAQELKRIFDEGEKYTNAGLNLVQDDFQKIKEHLMSRFEETKGSLRHRKGDVNSTLRDQLHFGKIVKDGVQHWLERVEKQVESAEDEVRRDGCLPPSRVANLLEEKIRELNQLLDEGKEYTNPGVVLVKDDPLTIRGIPLIAERCYGRDTALQKILECLKGEEVTRIAVWGMGGVGKTTFMKQVHNQLLKESKFDKVIWVTVSQNLNFLKIQDEIVKQLNEAPLAEDDATRRAGTMSAMLGRGSYLLVLDDTWDAFSVEEVGFLANSGDNSSKLVLTTRSKDVVRQIDCNLIIELKPLSSEQALELFLQKVGGAVLSDDGNIKPRLKSAIMQIVEECDGLPLAIVTVASTMKGKSERHAWAKALKQLQEASKILFAGEKNPMGILKFSYDRLEDKKLQDCFLYCALYPEDAEIKKRELIEYWIGEGFIGDQMGTWDEMICEGLEILRKLQDNCLLECIQSKNNYKFIYTGEKLSEVDDEAVKMHDLLRDMALDISSQSHLFFVKAGLSEEELQKKEAWAEKVEKVSFMSNDMEEIPLAISDLKYDMLTTLLMPDHKIVTIPESFFSQMPRLQVLDLSENYGLKSLPNSLSNLKNLTALLLMFCRALKEVPSLSKCRALIKLDLSHSGIEQVPKGMEMLVNLKSLDLSGSPISQLLKGKLPNLPNLQRLVGNEMDVEEVVRLKKLEYVQFGAKSMDELNRVFRYMQNQVKSLLQVETPLVLSIWFLDFTVFFKLLLDSETICQTSMRVGQGEDDSYFRFVDQILILEASSPWILGILPNYDMEGVFISWFNRLQTLETLVIHTVGEVESIFDEEALGLPVSPPESNSFFSLKRIEIVDCSKLKRLFSSALLLGYLQNLEYISVQWCVQIEEIISSSHEEGAPEKLTLPKLKRLVLKSLPALKSICSSVLICSSLEILEIGYCKKLRRVPLCFPQLNNTPPSLPPSLKSIKMSLSAWESTEWDQPSAKDVLLPLLEVVEEKQEA